MLNQNPVDIFNIAPQSPFSLQYKRLYYTYVVKIVCQNGEQKHYIGSTAETSYLAFDCIKDFAKAKTSKLYFASRNKLEKAGYQIVPNSFRVISFYATRAEALFFENSLIAANVDKLVNKNIPDGTKDLPRVHMFKLNGQLVVGPVVELSKLLNIPTVVLYRMKNNDITRSYKFPTLRYIGSTEL